MFNKDVKVPLQEAELVGTSSSNIYFKLTVLEFDMLNSNIYFKLGSSMIKDYSSYIRQMREKLWTRWTWFRERPRTRSWAWDGVHVEAQNKDKFVGVGRGTRQSP